MDKGSRWPSGQKGIDEAAELASSGEQSCSYLFTTFPHPFFAHRCVAYVPPGMNREGKGLVTCCTSDSVATNHRWSVSYQEDSVTRSPNLCKYDIPDRTRLPGERARARYIAARILQLCSIRQMKRLTAEATPILS